MASGASYYILLSPSHCYQDIKFPSAYLSSLLSVSLSFPLDSHCSSWLVTRKRWWKGQEEKSGGLLKIQSGQTEEEGMRLVGETEKQASYMDLVTLSFSSSFSPYLSSFPCSPSSLWHESDFESVYISLSFPLLFFPSLSLILSSLVSPGATLQSSQLLKEHRILEEDIRD